jgi:hypothetical protein
LDLKGDDSGGLVSLEQFGGTLKGPHAGVVEFIRSKSLFLREGDLISIFQGLQARLS